MPLSTATWSPRWWWWWWWGAWQPPTSPRPRPARTRRPWGTRGRPFQTRRQTEKERQKKGCFFCSRAAGACRCRCRCRWTYVFIKDGGGGALEEVPKTIAEPPPSFLALAVSAFLKPDKLSTRKLGGTVLQEPAELSVVRVIGEGGPAPATGDGRGRQNQETAKTKKQALFDFCCC